LLDLLHFTLLADLIKKDKMLRQHIVAIGGSAGSLEAILEIFDHTPLNNASYVILQYLPKGYKSNLKSILGKHSKLQVAEAMHPQTILCLSAMARSS
jgi:chemotaxis response regulator CheB